MRSTLSERLSRRTISCASSSSYPYLIVLVMISSMARLAAKITPSRNVLALKELRRRIRGHRKFAKTVANREDQFCHG